MMKQNDDKYVVISPSHLPTRFPLGMTILVWLLLDRLQVDGWVGGVVWTIVGLVWIVSIIRFNAETRLVFSKRDENEKE